MNKQPISKFISLLENRGRLAIHSIFHTIQGEGPFSGHPAVFIRLNGCNLQCQFCDTEYTAINELMLDYQIVAKVRKLIGDNGTKLIVITGGEPFRQNITPISDIFCNLGFTVQVETNGTLPPSQDLNHDVVIVCSPKTGKVNPEMVKRVNAFKYVLNHKSQDIEDGLPISVLGHSVKDKVFRPQEGDTRTVYLQPMDAHDHIENKHNIDATVQACLKFNYVLQLQTHKYIGVE